MRSIKKYIFTFLAIISLSACETMHEVSTSFEEIWLNLHTSDEDLEKEAERQAKADLEYDPDFQDPPIKEPTRKAESENPSDNKTSAVSMSETMKNHGSADNNANNNKDIANVSVSDGREDDMRIASACPDYDIVKDLGQLHQFYNPESPEPGDRIAQINISDMVSECSRLGEDIVLDIKITFDAMLGPRSRIFEKDQPSISYPYFIAVTNKNGEILNKSIHAVSMTFGPLEVTKSHNARLKEIITLDPDNHSADSVNDIMILTGFQLTEDELAYNLSLSSGNASGDPADIRPRRNTGVNTADSDRVSTPMEMPDQ